MDAVVAILILLSTLSIISAAMFKVGELVSEDLLYKRLSLTLDGAIATLLLGEGDWACYAGGIRIPGCVVEGSYATDKNRFFVNPVDCNLQGSDSLATLMGCDAPIPEDPKLIISRDFSACVTDSEPQLCVPKNLRLTIWVGQ